jgi:hypothetical protein
LNRHRYLLVGFPLLGAVGGLGLFRLHASHPGAVTAVTAPPSPPSQGRRVLADYAHLPLSFEINQGQTDRRVRFVARGIKISLFLTPAEAVFTTPDSKQAAHPIPGAENRGRKQAPAASPPALRMQIVGADPAASAAAEQPLPGKINYLLGHDPGRWRTGIPTCARARFRQVYPGVDVVYYGNQTHLEYDFVVAPHADPGRIRLRFAGTDRVRVDKQGDLIVGRRGRTLTWRKPTVYQEGTDRRQTVSGRFTIRNAHGTAPTVSFALGPYDTGRQLIIDPVLIYSTYLGGSTQDIAYGIAVDSNGNAYIAGSTGSTDFPVTPGAFQTTENGATSNAFVTKLNPTGTALVYSTYLGGNAQDTAYGIAVDSSGNAYVAGSTSSTDFPATPGAFQTSSRGTSNAFVTKLNPTGTALIYSTFLGGNTQDAAYGIAVDNSGNAYIAGYTDSTNFPITPGAFQTSSRGGGSNAAFVTKLNPTGTALIYSTLLGGSGQNYGVCIAADSSGSAYVSGQTSATDFPVTTGAFQTTRGGGSSSNTFVTKFNATGSALIYSTYLRETNDGGGENIAVDGSGNAYVVGSTSSTDFPITPGAFQTTNRAPSGSSTGFVTKLNAVGAGLVYSTFLGGSGDSIVDGVAVDAGGNAYVTGFTASADFPTTPGVTQRVKGAGTNYDAFVTRLNATGTALIYSTYLGGSSQDNAYGIALDGNGNAYVAGSTGSTNFPITPGAFQTTESGATNSAAFATKLFPVPIFPDFNNDGYADLLIQNSGTGQIACWFMNQTVWTGGVYFSLSPSANYALVGVGNFAGDSTNALVLQNRSDNTIAFWYTGGVNNAAITGGAYVSPYPTAGWKVVGVADFNGDGKSDLVFQSQTTNQIAIWYMNGPNYQGGVLLPYTPPAGWRVVGTGDVNGDGFPDLVFQNQSTGQVAIWFMNRSTYVGGSVLSTVPAAGWKVVGVGDYNRDGYADLLFQNQTTNHAAIWFLKGATFIGGDSIPLVPPTGWQIVGPR